ncbi:hypothetical protein ACH5RR_005605 [Cinchona calisaya]|uniref:F-box domain-containing protein n=1 Tax=Cinchona calisaya TaxID=153742 RepID=A0ABD3ALX6_9GENT
MTECINSFQLPEDVILEIFSRLPVKSLLRFRSVCKYWCPDFVAKHFHHQTNQEKLFVHCHHVYDSNHHALSFFPDDYLAGISSDFQHHIPTPTSFSAVLGPMDGLVFLYDDHNLMAIWNPETKEVKHLLPLLVQSPASSESLLSLYSPIFGFGKDPSCNDFKIKNYTVSNLCNCNTYLDGFYYWRAISNCKIFAFDVRIEIFSEIKTPDAFKSMQRKLALYKDCLAIYAYNRRAHELSDIRVMEVEESRTKKMTVGPLLNISSVLGYWKNGEIAIKTRRLRPALFHPDDTKEIRILGPLTNINCYCKQIYTNPSPIPGIREISAGGGD